MSVQDKKKIVVAMSGGVDSSTVAALLHSQGHEVIGVTLQLYDHGVALEKKGACCAGQDIYDAQMVAEKLGIPHYVLDYESIFKESVIEEFADSYIRGETPIPCVRCNQSVKFKDLFKVAKDLGADALATGHYIQRKMVDGKACLYQGADDKKDQSYFLFATTQEQLNFLMFPLGHLDKEKTRKLAKSFGLEIADKPDSQDICFVPNGDYKKVIEKVRPGALESGNIILKDGTVIGRHSGIINFTVGQRRGIGIAHKSPLYVIKIDAENNNVVVGEKEDLAGHEVYLKDTNWLADEIPTGGMECDVKLRSVHKGLKATIFKKSGSDKAYVKLDQPYEGITPGQACVAYHDKKLLGGGWIISEKEFLA